jgi:hypothetical protein
VLKGNLNDIPGTHHGRIPAAFNVSRESLSVLNRFLTKRKEDSFETLKRSGKLFYADYEILNGIDSKDDRIFYSSIVLLYLSNTGKLMPLAVQLTRNQINQIYTPDDREEVWLFARMHATLSDSLVHEMVSSIKFRNQLIK